MALVHEQFAKALSAVGAISKGQKNSHHGYAFRGIDDVINALHGVLADHQLFYVPRLDHAEYDEWQTSRGGRLQVARLHYCLDFYATDGTSMTVGPVVGQSADTDDKAPMQALSQAAKVGLLHAFCIPTQEMGDADRRSPLSDGGGRVARQGSRPVDPGKLQEVRDLYDALPEGATSKTVDELVEFASQSEEAADATVSRLSVALEEHQAGDEA